MNLELISLILNFILATGIVGQLVLYRINKRKALAEASTLETSGKSAEVSLVSDSVNKMLENSNMLMKAYNEMSEKYVKSEKDKEELIMINRELVEKMNQYIKTNKEVLRRLDKMNLPPEVKEELKKLEHD